MSFCPIILWLYAGHITLFLCVNTHLQSSCQRMTPLEPTIEQSLSAIRADIVVLLRSIVNLQWTILPKTILALSSLFLAIIFYTVLTLRNQRNPLKVWESMNMPILRIIRSYLFTFLVRRVNPYSSSISYDVLTVHKGVCTGVLKEQHRVRNPFKSIHAGALATFAETIGGIAALSAIGPKERVLLIKLDIDFVKKARGLITGTSTFNVDQDKSRRNIAHEVVLKDETLETVATARLTWNYENKS